MQKRGGDKPERGEVRGVVDIEGPLERPAAAAVVELKRYEREAGAGEAYELPAADEEIQSR